jgi:hypothetical protein
MPSWLLSQVTKITDLTISAPFRAGRWILKILSLNKSQRALVQNVSLSRNLGPAKPIMEEAKKTWTTILQAGKKFYIWERSDDE